MKKGDISFSMVVWAVLALIVIALMAYFLWRQFVAGAGTYVELQNQSTKNLSWLS